MTEENNNKQEEAESLFEGMAVNSPRLKVNIPEVKVAKSFSETEEYDVGESDLKATLKRLFPKMPYDIVDRTCRVVMVGRVLHDSMLDRISLTVTAMVEDWDEELYGKLYFQELLDMVTTAYEIGLDSKGRIDAEELHSSARESEDLAKLVENS